MAEVRLRKNFQGVLISKQSFNSLWIRIEFDYKGPTQMLDFEYSTGKKGLWGDYDQESPTYHQDKKVYHSVGWTRYYYTLQSIPLSFWGTREIGDCAVEVVIRGEGVFDDAVLWDAYTVNL